MERPFRRVGRSVVALVLAGVSAVLFHGEPAAKQSRLLDDELLVTWYGNPRSAAMGVLGQAAGEARAAALGAQADAYRPLTRKTVVPAYELVAVVAQCTPGAEGRYRRRETADVVTSLLAEARAHGFRLVVDIQPGRSPVADEVAAFSGVLGEPDVYLALDPEYGMDPCEIPGQHIGQLRADDVNAAIGQLETIIARRQLPPKVLIVHQFRLDMLPDKRRIRTSPVIDLVLDMDGFGARTLKLSTYREIMRQGQLDHAGFKIFFRQDTDPFTPAEVLRLRPEPSVVIYQ